MGAITDDPAQAQCEPARDVESGTGSAGVSPSATSSLASSALDVTGAAERPVKAAGTIEANGKTGLEAGVAVGVATNVDAQTREKVAVVFKGVNYVVKVKRKEKAILEDVNGFFYPGNLTAIMGPSGSGKTTLMDIVLQRKTTGKVTGELMANGNELTRTIARRTCSYVEQDDVLLESLSVQEMLTYTAALCWPWQPAAWRRELIDSLIATLGLEKCRASRIGGATLRG